MLDFNNTEIAFLSNKVFRSMSQDAFNSIKENGSNLYCAFAEVARSNIAYIAIFRRKVNREEKYTLKFMGSDFKNSLIS